MLTKEEQRLIIRLIRSENVLEDEIPRKLSVEYGDSALTCIRVYEWTEKFKINRKSEARKGSGTIISADGLRKISTTLKDVCDEWRREHW